LRYSLVVNSNRKPLAPLIHKFILTYYLNLFCGAGWRDGWHECDIFSCHSVVIRKQVDNILTSLSLLILRISARRTAYRLYAMQRGYIMLVYSIHCNNNNSYIIIIGYWTKLYTYYSISNFYAKFMAQE